MSRRSRPTRAKKSLTCSIASQPHPLAPKLAPDNHGLIWLPEEAFDERVRAGRELRTNSRCSRGAAADLAGLHHGAGGASALEGRAELVPGRGGRPHDYAGDAAFHGRADEGAGAGRIRSITPRSSPRRIASTSIIREAIRSVRPVEPQSHSQGETPCQLSAYQDRRRRRLQGLLSGSRPAKRAEAAAAARLPDLRPYVPRSDSAAGRSFPYRRAGSAGLRPVRHAAATRSTTRSITSPSRSSVSPK